MAKNSMKPQIRFKGFTDAWEQRKCKELCSITTGKSNTQDQVEDGLYPFYIRSDMPVRSNKYLYDCEAVITIGDGQIGKVFHYVNGKFDLHQRCYKMADFVGIFGKYFFYYFSTKFYDRAIKMTAKATVDSVRMDMISEMDIQYPISSQEQRQIALFLERLDNLITLHQRKYEKFVNIKKALLEKMFPQGDEKVPRIRFKGFTDAWEQRKLGDIGRVAMNRRIFKEQTSDEGSVPFYKIGTFGGEPDAFISDELYQEYKALFSYPKIGDILLSASGSIGKIVEYKGEKAYFQDSNIVWLDHDASVSNSFLKCFYSVVKWAGLEGSTIKRLYNKNILETKIALPSYAEQVLIGVFFEGIDNLITLHQRQVEKLKNIKSALLEKMFV